MNDQEFLELVIKALVEHPDDVKIDRKVDEMGVLLTLDVNAADMGKVIGRSGATAKAIRVLLRVVGMKNNARVNLKINEPEGGLMSRMPQGGSEQRPAPTYAPDRPSASNDIDQALEDLKL